jgi:PPOX class probable F420-dependent enzyme
MERWSGLVTDLIKDELVRELLEAPFPCCLTSLDRDGSPYGVVVWCAPDGGRITVNAARGLWLRNLRRDPRVSLVVVDTGNILRHVSVQGRVVGIDPDERYAHIDSLSQVYEGRRYQYSTPEEVPRFRVAIEPDRVRTLDLAPAEGEVR